MNQNSALKALDPAITGAMQTFDRFNQALCSLYQSMEAEVPDLGSGDRPVTVCLCGSSRFHKEYVEWNYRLTLLGYVVLSVGFFPHSQEEVHGQEVGCTDQQKEMLDRLHKHKIMMADNVFIINPGGYIGESTRSEIEFAHTLGKDIYYLEARVRDQVAQEEDFVSQATQSIYGTGIIKRGQPEPGEGA